MRTWQEGPHSHTRAIIYDRRLHRGTGVDHLIRSRSRPSSYSSDNVLDHLAEPARTQWLSGPHWDKGCLITQPSCTLPQTFLCVNPKLLSVPWRQTWESLNPFICFLPLWPHWIHLHSAFYHYSPFNWYIEMTDWSSLVRDATTWGLYIKTLLTKSVWWHFNRSFNHTSGGKGRHQCMSTCKSTSVIFTLQKSVVQ